MKELTQFSAHPSDDESKEMYFPMEKDTSITPTALSPSHQSSEKQFKLSTPMGLMPLSLSQNEIQQTNFIIILAKSSDSLNNLTKNEEASSRSPSVSSNSAASLSPSSNFNETDLKLLDPSQTSTPILSRNQASRQDSLSPKSTRSDLNPRAYDGIDITSFNAAIVHQKTLLRARKEKFNKKFFLENISIGHKMYDTLSQPKKIPPCQITPITFDSLDSNFSSTNSMIINPSSGTVRGTVNHVKLSVKHVFEREKFATNPVLNAKLNDINITSLDQSNNYNVLNNSIDQTIYDKNQSETTSNNRMRKSMDKTLNLLARNYEIEECQKIVVYTTSLQIVRLAFDKCKRAKKILQNYCVRYEEKDLYKNKEHQRELKYRLNLDKIDLPHIFFNGRLLGNCDQLELYSDQGLLHKLFKDLEKIKLKIYCSKCGGYRFVLCTVCNGSKKKFNNFTILKCTNCTEDGLIRCDGCLDQQE